MEEALHKTADTETVYTVNTVYSAYAVYAALAANFTAVLGCIRYNWALLGCTALFWADLQTRIKCVSVAAAQRA